MSTNDLSSWLAERPWADRDANHDERWAGYLDPNTGLLRTLSAKSLGTEAELRRFEDDRVEDRWIELRDEPIQGDFGMEHLQAIHRHLFQDVYPWAGEIRTVGIEKDDQKFLHPDHAKFYIDGTARMMREDGMLRPGMDTLKWSGLLAERFNDVNDAHPFREGNGRTQRTYFDQVAEAGGKTIHWNVLSKEQNIAVSHKARKGDLTPLREAFSVMVTDRMNPLALQRAKQAAETMRAVRPTAPGPTRGADVSGAERGYYGRDGRASGQGPDLPPTGYER